jgi:hypothetical protein
MLIALTAALFTIAAIAVVAVVLLAIDLYKAISHVESHTRQLGAATAALAELLSMTLLLTKMTSERVVELESEWYIDNADPDDDEEDTDEDGFDPDDDEPPKPVGMCGGRWKYQ